MNTKPTVRIALILARMDYGGIEAVVMNYLRHMPDGDLQFELFVDEGSLLPQQDELDRLGIPVHLMPPYTSLISYLRQCYRAFRNGKFDIVHAHMNTMSVFPLMAAWAAKVPVRICHNHTTAHVGEGKKTILKYLLRPFSTVFATHYFACGKKAATWMYGQRRWKENRVYLMRNAIDIDRFSFSEAERQKQRQKLGIKDQWVLGHIGRFAYPKNHAFLIEIFASLHRMRPDTVLLLAGSGSTEKEIHERVHQLCLDDCVQFLGDVTEPEHLYQAFDVVCLPSFYEGLSVVLIEAQDSGLPCVVSDTVTQEAAVSPAFVSLKLTDSPEKWASTVSDKFGKRIPAQQARDNLTKNGYSISACAVELYHKYLEMAEER